MRDNLRRDYQAMVGMIFGPIPHIDEVLANISQFEQHLNKSS
jgi:hypothetical protein